MIKRRRLDPVRRNIPTEEQFRALIENVRQEECSGEKYADFLDFLGRAGVGQAEACALEWRDVSATKMRFVRRKTRVAFEVPIYSWLVPLITKLRSRSPADQGRVFDVQDAGKALRRACRRLGLVEGKQRPKFTQRSLRAMLIKRLYDAGIPVKRIALWQGHRDGGKLIQEVYTEVFCDTDQAAEDADLARIGAVNMESIAALQVVK
jgi:integrase